MGSGNLTGSRYCAGNVPNVNWNGKLNVNWVHPSNANANWRTRQVISIKQPLNGLLYINR